MAFLLSLKIGNSVKRHWKPLTLLYINGLHRTPQPNSVALPMILNKVNFRLHVSQVFDALLTSRLA